MGEETDLEHRFELRQAMQMCLANIECCEEFLRLGRGFHEDERWQDAYVALRSADDCLAQACPQIHRLRAAISVLKEDVEKKMKEEKK